MSDGFKSLLDDDGSEDLKTGPFARMRAYFLAGILVTAPIGITIYLTWIFLQFINNRVTALIPWELNPFNYLPLSVPGVQLIQSIASLIIVIASFILIGWFARNVLGRMIYRIFEYVMHQVPVINKIYNAIKQIMETIMASQSQAFREVVVLEYPRKGVWSLGFVTGRSEGEVQRTTAEETMSVFVPTTPNPTSGYLLFVPKKELYFLDMTVEEAAKLIVSAGIIVPPDRGNDISQGKRVKTAAIKAEKATKKAEIQDVAESTSISEAAKARAVKAKSPKAKTTKKAAVKKAATKKKTASKTSTSK